MTAGVKQQTRLGAVIQAMLWTTLGEIVAPTIVGLIIWRFGAGYTVLALQWIAQAFTGQSQSGIVWYVAPILFSAIELALWKLKDQMSPRVRRLAYGMAVIDLLSTALGIGLAVLNSYLPRLGVEAEAQDWRHQLGAVVVALVAAWWVTFSPEKYLVDAFFQTIEIARFLNKVYGKKGAKNGS